LWLQFRDDLFFKPFVGPFYMSFNHGFLILDKPLGITSAKAVAEVKRLLKCKKIGHGGTLDPLASGVLPLAIGEATKAFEYVASARKEYRFTIAFGEERATGDAEGEVTETTSFIPAADDIARVLPDFTGAIMQVPPAFSALKINGQPAYKKARAGERVEMAARPVEIHSITLLSESPATCRLRLATFSVTCGKGTYVRSLARDIARKCNSLGYVSMLRRVSVGKFHESNAISLDKLPESVHNAALLEAWVPIKLALDDIPAIDLDPHQALALRRGRTVRISVRDGTCMALDQGQIVALAQAENDMLTVKRVFNII
jgi:tRNA pseudouridine55 synthase